MKAGVCGVKLVNRTETEIRAASEVTKEIRSGLAPECSALFAQYELESKAEASSRREHETSTAVSLKEGEVFEVRHARRVGAQRSGKTGDGPDRYSFQVAYDYLAGLLDELDANQNVTLVIHDWGSALGFYWAQQHGAAVKGIAYMEGIVCPVGWEDWPESARGIFKGFRSDKGEDLILQRNMFVEAVLPSSVIRKLGAEEMEHYRRAFSTPDDRQPTLNWPRQIPIDGEPEHMVKLVDSYGQWMLENTSLPKLFINATPGSILTGKAREFCRTWPNQYEVTVAGTHFIQEDSPDEIGSAVAEWLNSL